MLFRGTEDLIGETTFKYYTPASLLTPAHPPPVRSITGGEDVPNAWLGV
jgi:hypothetical protein